MLEIVYKRLFYLFLIFGWKEENEIFVFVLGWCCYVFIGEVKKVVWEFLFIISFVEEWIGLMFFCKNNRLSMKKFLLLVIIWNCIMSFILFVFK